MEGTTFPKYFLTNSGCSFTASENEQKMIPSSLSLSLKVVPIETESITASTATPLNLFCSCNDIPNFSNVLISSGSTSSIDLSIFFFLGAE